MLALNNLKPNKSRTKERKRVGRGDASGTGTYSGRGLKGQRSRSGGKGGLKLRGMRDMLFSTPKLRGFKSLRPKNTIVNLMELDENFSDGDIVNPQNLFEKKIIGVSKGKIKILVKGKLNKKVNIEGCLVSKSARQQIESLGGTVKK